VQYEAENTQLCQCCWNVDKDGDKQHGQTSVWINVYHGSLIVVEKSRQHLREFWLGKIIVVGNDWRRMSEVRMFFLFKWSF
jgi:hypothetical protein